MFLKKVMENNQPLVKTTISLHREWNIPPTTFVLDLDMIRKNAAELKDEAVKNNLKMYLMVKSFNRNPFVSTIAVSEGFEGVVAVNFQGASVHDRYNIPIKHIGHLVQVPMHYILKALKLNPEVITVFSYIEAKRISASAKILGKRQDLLIRVYNKDNILFGLCRLRIFNKQAIIREIHIYGQALKIGEKAKEIGQHKGLGKKLLKQAEKITKENKIFELKIISGVGVRQYYKKLGYKLDEQGYMIKEL